MNYTLLLQALGVFGGGMAASLSPCVYPLIPITVGMVGRQSPQHQQRSILLYFFGQTLSFSILGSLTVQLGETLGFTSENRWINGFTGLGLLAFALMSFFGKMPNFTNNLNSKLSRITNSKFKFLAPFILGVAAALLTSPCTTPILSSILGILATEGEVAKGITLMVIYSFGFSFVFLVLGFGIIKAKKLPKAGQWLNKLHHFSTLLLFVASLYFIYKSVI